MNLHNTVAKKGKMWYNKVCEKIFLKRSNLYEKKSVR